MFEPDESAPAEPQPSSAPSNTLRNVLLAVAALYVAISLYFLFDMHSRLAAVEQKQTATANDIAGVHKHLAGTDANLKASSEALAAKLGMTEKELSSRTAQLRRQQQQAEERLAQEQKQQISAVSGEVAAVKTDVGSAKTELASTKGDVEGLKTKLESMRGDLGIQSGLIAHTRDELEVLKHRGDRNYYEFTLDKGKKPMPVSTVSLELKKVDPKKGKFTMDVIADDRKIEKKDRNVNEPVQFYTGRDRMLYELVVFTADKNKVTGYLSTPKNAPQPLQTNN